MQPNSTPGAVLHASGTPVQSNPRRRTRPRKLYVYVLFAGPDRVGLMAESTRFVATFGAEIRDMNVGVVRQNVFGALNFEVTRPALSLLRAALPGFKSRTGLSVKVFNVVDVEPVDDLNDPPQYLEFSVASDYHAEAIADVSELTARNHLNVVVAKTERFRVRGSSIIQMRQRYLVQAESGFDRESFIHDLELLLGRRPYNGVILLPPRLTGSKIWQ